MKVAGFLLFANMPFFLLQFYSKLKNNTAGTMELSMCSRHTRMKQECSARFN